MKADKKCPVSSRKGNIQTTDFIGPALPLFQEGGMADIIISWHD